MSWNVCSVLYYRQKKEPFYMKSKMTLAKQPLLSVYDENFMFFLHRPSSLDCTRSRLKNSPSAHLAQSRENIKNKIAQNIAGMGVILARLLASPARDGDSAAAYQKKAPHYGLF